MPGGTARTERTWRWQPQVEGSEGKDARIQPQAAGRGRSLRDVDEGAVFGEPQERSRSQQGRCSRTLVQDAQAFKQLMSASSVSALPGERQLVDTTR